MNGLGRRVARRALLGCSAALAALIVCSGSAPAEEAAPRYPVVIAKAKTLRTLGLVIKSYTSDTEETPLLPTRCYYYGDGGYDLSVSNEFLARFKARGFSRRSLCMALVSEARFDPETGQRLPTYILANIEKMTQPGNITEPGDVTSELPFDVPDCFKNGVPYSDCKMNFDLETGRKLTPQATRALKEVGARLEAKLRDPAFRKAFKYDKKCETAIAKKDDDCEFSAGMIAIGAGHKSLGVGAPSRATIYDYSPEFPKGFGYALNADGTAAPDPSVGSVTIAMDGNYRATEASLRLLTDRLKSR